MGAPEPGPLGGDCGPGEAGSQGTVRGNPDPKPVNRGQPPVLSYGDTRHSDTRSSNLFKRN